MDNQNIGKIAMKTGNRPRSKFNMKSDTTTTTSFGECQPVLVRQCQPNTKSVISHDVLVRLAPLVAPCRARMGVRLLSKFVGFSELTENFEALRTKQRISRGSQSFIPSSVPHISLGFLSAMCLVGAKWTLYRNGQSADPSVSSQFMADKSADLVNLNSVAFNALRGLMGVNQNTIPNSQSNKFFDCLNGYAGTAYFESWGMSTFKNLVNVGRLLGWSHDFWIPTANNGGMGSFTIPKSDADGTWSWVDVQAADLVFPYVVDNSGTTSSGWAAVRLSSFGQRLRKILIGCGYQLDVLSSIQVSLMPLFAYYKAYFDSFGLMLYENWENNPVARLMRHYDDTNLHDFTSFINNNPNGDSVPCRWLIDFISRLGLTFYTDEQDYVSMQTRSQTVSSGFSPSDALSSPIPNAFFADGTQVVAAGDTSSEPIAAGSNGSGLNYIDVGTAAVFSNLDIEILRKAYQVTNRDTIAGKRIAEALKARGEGEYVTQCKSRFIGESYVPVNVDDVDVTANGFDSATGQGMVAGEYVGKGIGFDEGQTFTYENNEYGYLITIACVIPDSGYVQQFDPQCRAVSRSDFYQGDFDGMGFEAITRRDVCGQNDFCRSNGDESGLDGTFGFAPRQSRHKVPFSRLNGDFSRMSQKDKYLPYNLDRYIPQGDKVFTGVSDGSDVYSVEVVDALTPLKLPLASPNYRYIGRVPWLGFLGRIFNYLGEQPTRYEYGEDFALGLDRHWEYTNDLEDTFMLFVFNNLNQYAPMLPIEESFETTEDGNNGSTDTSISKS